MNLEPATSPTGTPIIPPRLVPYIQVLSSILVCMGAELGLPGPWTPERYFMVASAVLSIVLGTSSAGNRR